MDLTCCYPEHLSQTVGVGLIGVSLDGVEDFSLFPLSSNLLFLPPSDIGGFCIFLSRFGVRKLLKEFLDVLGIVFFHRDVRYPVRISR